MARSYKGFIHERYVEQYGYTQAPAHMDVNGDVTNYSYILRNILLKNINPIAHIENASIHTDDHILRPIALLDVAYRDLQLCKDWKMPSYAEKRRYHRTMQYMHTLFARFYRHMSEDQIYVLNEAMEKMEEKIQKDYTILKIQCSEALRPSIPIDLYRDYLSTLCVMHVCVNMPMRYIYEYLHARIDELERVSKNIHMMLQYYANDGNNGTGDIDLKKMPMVEMSLKAFQNKFLYTEMTI